MDRLARGALMHDVGKARIPTEVLDKPGELTSIEVEMVRRHPVIGANILLLNGAFDKEVVEIVTNHHEYLDGSGYPAGLRGSQISDLVRLVTICDIFGALVEQRAYKPALPASKAYDILVEMGSKLDGALVRAFQTVARSIRT
jgi:putative nucleotidyltransferase with HDIG domain